MSKEQKRDRSLFSVTRSPRALERMGALKPGAAKSMCGQLHPERKEVVNGVPKFLHCQRPADHKVQHRAKTRAGYVWWS